MLDVVILGEALLRLTPPGRQRFEQAQQFDIFVAGSEANTAIGLARFGHSVAWLSRLPDHALGRRVASALAACDVDVSHVVWAESDERLAIYYMEEGAAPRASQVIYDRRDSSLSRMQPEMLSAGLFQPGQARHLHLTGITVAVSSGAAATALAAATLARQAGWTFSFDVNYRAKLWDTAAARQGCAPFVDLCDLLISPLRDARRLFDVDADSPAEAVLAQLAARYPSKTIVLTLGSEGALGVGRNGVVVRQPGIAVEEISRIGAGDAFAAGLLHGYLQDADDLVTTLRWATAAAAVKITIPGDFPLFNQREVAQLVQGDASMDVVR